MLCIFTPINSTRNQQLIRIKYEDHIQSMFSLGLIFFLARACQLKTNKIGITILSPSQSSYAIYKLETILKALIFLNLIPLEKYCKQYISYFYKILHFMMNPTKFSSPHLDVPSCRYEFLKHAFKCVKTNKKTKTHSD